MKPSNYNDYFSPVAAQSVGDPPESGQPFPSTTTSTASATSTVRPRPPPPINVGAIVGEVVGGVLGLLLIVLIVCLIVRRLRKKRPSPGNGGGQVELPAPQMFGPTYEPTVHSDTTAAAPITLGRRGEADSQT